MYKVIENQTDTNKKFVIAEGLTRREAAETRNAYRSDCEPNTEYYLELM